MTIKRAAEKKKKKKEGVRNNIQKSKLQSRRYVMTKTASGLGKVEVLLGKRKATYVVLKENPPVLEVSFQELASSHQ